MQLIIKMVPEAPLHIDKGQDEKGSNSLAPDSVQGKKALDQSLEHYVEERARERYSEVYEENERLKKENSDLTEGSKELVRKYGELHKEINRLKQENRELKMSMTNPAPSFNYYIDTRIFEKSDKGVLEKLWDNILLLCEIKDGEHYLINAQTHVVPIYILIKEWSGFPYKFTGTYGDFCYAWNENVTVRLSSQERRELLTLKEGSFKAAVNDKSGVWKSDVSEWGRKAKEGAFVEMYERGEKIKGYIKSWGM